MSNRKFYLVESGESYGQCDQFRKSYNEAVKELSHYVESIGANKYRTGFNNELSYVAFPRGHNVDLANFIKPGKDGATRPRHKSPLKKEFEKYVLPDQHDFISDVIGCPRSAKFSDAHDSECVVEFFGFQYNAGLAWYHNESPILLMLPDIERIVLETEVQNVGRNLRWVESDAIQWRFKGGREILKEEYQLMQAKHEQEAAQ
ncbi:MAG: hypothetical protein AAF478_13660 [Pseudomonadota bacterium]